MTESFTLQRVWLNHLSVQASASFWTSISSSGTCRMFRYVLYGNSCDDLLECMIGILLSFRAKSRNLWIYRLHVGKSRDVSRPSRKATAWQATSLDMTTITLRHQNNRFPDP